MALHDGVIGGNLFVSNMYLVAVVVGFGASIPINVNTLQAMLAGAGMGSSKSKSILRFVYISNIVALTLLSLGMATVLTFLPLYAASTTESPNESVVVPALLVLYNVSVVMYLAFFSRLASYTSSKVRVIIAHRSEAAKAERAGGKACSADDVKMELLLTKLERSTQDAKKKTFVVGVLYGIFCLPSMHPYQVGGGHSFMSLYSTKLSPTKACSRLLRM
jgi:hypothetical protein